MGLKLAFPLDDKRLLGDFTCERGEMGERGERGEPCNRFTGFTGERIRRLESEPVTTRGLLSWVFSFLVSNKGFIRGVLGSGQGISRDVLVSGQGASVLRAAS